ncbi:MAG: UDP-glycosyltransferase [Flavobacterium sp.]|uniref:UDP-glycosyltransferase n=1 Tax=Flavobacterium sp. TaxID=239 RepID=UPI00260E0278|nr:UDP-glycosyltransferase [Flavobacterium sp.]MDD5151087.1 UDP-glycosyltransferase [Flavobacterium sp.]
MSKNKIFILLPDGIGLRNFAYTSFYKLGKELGFDVVFWNNTPFSLTNLGFNEIKIEKAKTHPLTDIYKNVKIQVELNLNIKNTNDNVYNTYRFPFSYSTLKNTIKSVAVQLLSKFYFSQSGLTKIRAKMNKEERKTLYYCQSLETLKKEKPALIFCTNQRPVLAIAPLLAAQDLGIPTACFIFSWDNLPKATMVVETDYYFVWSELMRKELLFYYPYIRSNQVFVTGTPQFETHFDTSKLFSREVFFKNNGLDLDKKYICYSGDDVTTCPDDSQYLEDVALSIRELNKKGYDLGIIFRRCPVDFSSRFDKVLANYNDVIVSVAPKWERKGEMWNTILPTPEDVILQANTIVHTEMVINLGSSMVFDYAAHNKSCAYINYDVDNKVLPNWFVSKIYKYVHFRSMPNEKAVIWLNNPSEIAFKIEKELNDSKETVRYAKNWFEIINQNPPQEASQRIWESIKKIIQ